jgi:hypothetical protein
MRNAATPKAHNKPEIIEDELPEWGGRKQAREWRVTDWRLTIDIINGPTSVPIARLF